MKKNKKNPPPIPSHVETNARAGLHLRLVLGSSFLMSFIVYLKTLAPTVTFEDSGELTAAAYLLGIPHEPGYPLFTMIGHLFTYLPFGNVAYRMNLMSAFFSALGAMFVAWSAILMIENARSNRNRSDWISSSPLVYACGFSASMLAAFSNENWEQSIITEVYGLNTFFVALVLTLTLLWNRQSDTQRRIKYFYAVCFLIGLALTNHPTFVLMIPVLLIYVWLTDRKFLMDLRRMLKGVGWVTAGLLPYAYLPLASLRNPPMDWGNPETPVNFFRVLMRHQYQSHDAQTLKKFIPQLSAYGQMMTEQWWPGILILALFGGWFLFRMKKNYFYLALIFLFFTGPLTTFLTNFDITTGNAIVDAENKALVSVFYIPSYLMLSLLIAFGLYAVAVKSVSNKKALPAVLALIVILPFAISFGNYKKLDMSRYFFTEDYIHNLFSVVPDNAVVFVNWDPFIFPCNYYQYVEGTRTDVTIVDQELLRRSWYIQSMRMHHASFMKRAEKEIDEFLDAVRPFENGEKFDGTFIQSKYIAMINALIDRSCAEGFDVFLTYDPPAGVAESSFKESVIAAVKLRKEMDRLTPLDAAALQFRNFFDPSVPLDRMAVFFKTYYGRLFFARGFVAEKMSESNEAMVMYDHASRFLSNNPAYLQQVKEARERLSKRLLK